jgi:hypothetical protein
MVLVIYGMSLFPILCSCPVRHDPAALVLAISSDQESCYSSWLYLILFSHAQDHIFCIRLFFQKYTVIVDPIALMSMFSFCAPEHVLQGFCMS